MRQAKATVRFETAPGEQAQVDWGVEYGSELLQPVENVLGAQLGALVSRKPPSTGRTTPVTNLASSLAR